MGAEHLDAKARRLGAVASLAALLATDSVDAGKKQKRKKSKKPNCQDRTKLCGATCIPAGTC